VVHRLAIASEIRGGVEIFCLRGGDDTCAAIAPGWGNACVAFRVQGIDVLEPVDWSALHEHPTSYGIPVLFPFPNRIRDGAFTFEGRRYVVTPPRHGFVRQRPWNVLSTGVSDEDGAWIISRFESTRYPEILAQFPWPFRLDVRYRLQGDTLHIETTVQHTGIQGAMPMGFGLHPYFHLPERGTIQVPAHRRWELTDSLPTGKLLDVEGRYDLRQPKDLREVGVVDDIWTDLLVDAPGVLRCILQDLSSGLQTVLECDPLQFPHIVVYTPPAPRRAICIEPYTCPTDAFNLQQRGVESHLLVLRPGDTHAFSIRISARACGVARRPDRGLPGS
jgi:aldose 1-epimerase